jgi:uncharacterized protein (DUF927 family)
MTQEELFDRKTFINLLNKKDLDRTDEENKLYLIAKRFGLEKEFKKTVKQYEKSLKQRISLEENKLPKCKYEIEEYDLGEYDCSINGITDKENHKFSNIPVLPVERYINKESGKEKVKIIFYKENKWKELTVDKSQLSISQKLLLLSDDGLDVNSNNVKYYIDYFSDILSRNDINKLESISHIGWRDNLFIPYDTSGIFDGEDDFKNIYKSIGSKGNYEKWKEVVRDLRKNKKIRIIMDTTLASPLIEKLNIPTFILNVWSSMSGSGKTLTCMAAMSIWGNPEIGGLTLSSNCTQNFYTTVASFMRNFTCYFDELQIIKNSKAINFDGLIMDLCNGTEKGRLNKNSQAKEVKTWKNNFLFTNNDRMVNENSGEQIYNRVIDMEIRDKIVENGQYIAKIIKENYGFAGKDYIRYVQKIGFDEIFKRFIKIFNEILETTNATDKQANSLAVILLSNQLANECIFEDESLLTISDLKEYINDKNEVRTCIKAKNYILNVIATNPKRFQCDNYGEYWGRKDDFNCMINYEILSRELKKGGFDFNTVKKDWNDLKFINLNSQGRYVHNTTVEGQKGMYVSLNITQ